MALPTASDNPFPSLLVTETAAASITSPASGKQRLFIDTDHALKLKNSGGTVSGVGGGAGADGWVDDTAETWTYASGSGGGTATFTVPTDLTAKYTPGTRIKLTQTTAKYFVVAASSYSAPNTTVTITAGSAYTLANAAISDNYHSYAENPQGYPGWFNYTIVWAGFAAASDPTVTLSRFMVTGRLCSVQIVLSAHGTSNATTFTLTGPIAAGVSGDVVGGRYADNSVTGTTPSRIQFTSGSATLSAFKDLSGAAWTASGLKSTQGLFHYPI